MGKEGCRERQAKTKVVSKVSIESGGDTDIEPRMKESEGKTMRFQKGIYKEIDGVPR